MLFRYLKWWFVERCLHIFGKGIFKYDIALLGPDFHNSYYRMMGMKIGKNVKIHKDAVIAQLDLITIGDNVVLDKCVARPASMEEGHLLMLPIFIGDNSSVGLKTSLAPGAELPANSHLGPMTCSLEMTGSSKHVSNKRYNRQCIPGPPWYLTLLLGWPILGIIYVISMVPWGLIIYWMVYSSLTQGWGPTTLTSFLDIIIWWTTRQRIFFYIGSRLAKVIASDTLRLFMGIIVKRCLLGKFEAVDGAAFLHPWNRFRYWMMPKLIVSGSFNGFTKLVGTHYAPVSMLYRLLGAKIGQRVYWPGSGLDIVEYDLLEIGDDVVFGSRSVVMTSTTDRSGKVTIESGCMVADRCCLLPGVTLRKGVVMGSGGLTKENFEYPMGSVWVGSVNGSSIMVSGEDRSIENKDFTTPFGRAFYKGKAKYFVVPLWMIIIYSTTWTCLCTVYSKMSVIAALYFARITVGFTSKAYFNTFMGAFIACYIACIPTIFGWNILALIIDISAKWLIIGRRKPGSYNWDESSYCQRWQMYLTSHAIRKNTKGDSFLDYLVGTYYLVLYFRMLGGKIGENVCLYPNGADPMMTEPDLVEICDNVCVVSVCLYMWLCIHLMHLFLTLCTGVFMSFSS